MQLEVNEKGTVVLRDVFNGIELVTSKGESLVVMMRDSGFEIIYNNIQVFELKEDSVRKVCNLMK